MAFGATGVLVLLASAWGWHEMQAAHVAESFNLEKAVAPAQ